MWSRSIANEVIKSVLIEDVPFYQYWLKTSRCTWPHLLVADTLRLFVGLYVWLYVRGAHALHDTYINK